jgi:hypothetical protein
MIDTSGGNIEVKKDEELLNKIPNLGNPVK